MSRRRQIHAIVIHCVRTAVVAALLLLIPSPSSSHLDDDWLAPTVKQVRTVLPDASEIAPQANEAGFWDVRNAEGERIAQVARTLPEAANVIGYRGPSESVIAFDADLNVIGVNLIQSADTEEHVAAVEQDADFWSQFQSWTWGGPPSGESIDAVSGATLTSLATAKGVMKRMGGDRPSLVFPDAIALTEVLDWYPDATQLKPIDDIVEVYDGQGDLIGEVLRTGRLSDSVVGYQGPTELLIRIDKSAEGGKRKIGDIILRSSFDNQPYVRYCKTEYGFWPLFEGLTVSELASMDLQAEGVEGVSGATMTSMAIAETLVASMKQWESRSTDSKSPQGGQPKRVGWIEWVSVPIDEFRITAADVGCVMILCLIPLFRLRGWFRKSLPRLLWLVSVILVIGFWSGNLVSMALIAGWSGGGMAWNLAPALAAIAIVAFVAPALGKSNPYCNHLCPHGAIQQLIRPKPKSRRHRRVPAMLKRVLPFLPGTQLVVAYLMLLFYPAIDLASWEPFHAYLIAIAPWTVIAFAVGTLVVSAMIPMAYCRLGCPTGRLLDHLRRSASSDRLRQSDAVAVALLIVAVFVQWQGIH